MGVSVCVNARVIYFQPDGRSEEAGGGMFGKFRASLEKKNFLSNVGVL